MLSRVLVRRVLSAGPVKAKAHFTSKPPTTSSSPPAPPTPTPSSAPKTGLSVAAEGSAGENPSPFTSPLAYFRKNNQRMKDLFNQYKWISITTVRERELSFL
jgi:hypothetical protein